MWVSRREAHPKELFLLCWIPVTLSIFDEGLAVDIGILAKKPDLLTCRRQIHSKAVLFADGIVDAVGGAEGEEKAVVLGDDLYGFEVSSAGGDACLQIHGFSVLRKCDAGDDRVGADGAGSQKKPERKKRQRSGYDGGAFVLF